MLFGVVVAALVLVTVPETVHAPFRLVPVRGADPVRTLHDGIVRDVRVLEAQAVTAGERMFVIASEPVGDRASERGVLQAQLGGTDARLANERLRYESQRLADEKEQVRLAQRLQNLARQRALKQQQLTLAREVADRQERSYREGLTSWVDASASRLQADRLAVEVEQVETEQAETQAALEKLRYEMTARAAGYTELQRSVREEDARARARKGMLDREPGRDSNELAVEAPCTGTVLTLRVQAPGRGRARERCARGGGLCRRAPPGRAAPAAAGARARRSRAGRQADVRRFSLSALRRALRDGAMGEPRIGRRRGRRVFRVFAELDESAVRVQGESRPLAPGMGGRAAIIVGRRSLVSYAFEPIRQMRENLASAR